MEHNINSLEQQQWAQFKTVLDANTTRPGGQYEVRKLGPNETALRLPTDRSSRVFDWETAGALNTHLAEVIELPRPEAI